MLRVRSKSDRDQLRKLYQQATRLALTPKNANWEKHKTIAESLKQELDDMLIFEEFQLMGNGAIRRMKP